MQLMNNIAEKIRENFYVDGENGKYLEYYENKDEILEGMDREVFENKFDVNVHRTSDIDALNYPIITFDSEGSPDGHLFDKHSTYDDIYKEAKDFFLKK